MGAVHRKVMYPDVQQNKFVGCQMVDEWFRDPEAIQMRHDIEQALQQTYQTAAIISTHEKVCAERYKTIIVGQKLVFAMLLLIALLSFLGPHDGILAAFHTVPK